MRERDQGGNAFPESVAVTPAGDIAYGMGGMTLRDYFAGQVIGELSVDPGMGRIHKDKGPEQVAGLLAMTAYAIADAMLKERLK